MSQPHVHRTCITRAHTSTRLRHARFICKLLQLSRQDALVNFDNGECFSASLQQTTKYSWKKKLRLLQGRRGTWREGVVLSPLRFLFSAHECLESKVGKCHHILLLSFFTTSSLEMSTSRISPFLEHPQPRKNPPFKLTNTKFLLIQWRFFHGCGRG